MEHTFDALLRDLRERLTTLPDKPEETPEATLRALWFAAAGLPRSVVASAGSDALPALDATPGGWASLRGLLARRLEGEPLAHITGRQHFMGMEMLSGPGALIPRIETEQLARCAIELLRQRGHAGPATVIDVCTGSGNLALAMARHVEDARVFAADISADAIDLARRNATHLGLAGRVEFRTGDLLAPFEDDGLPGRVDLVVCNPPYISTAKVAAMPAEISLHEPAAAFDGGALGVSILMRLVDAAVPFLRPQAHLAFEVGAGQGPSLARRLRSRPDYAVVREIADDGGVIRAIIAQRGVRTAAGDGGMA